MNLFSDGRKLCALLLLGSLGVIIGTNGQASLTIQWDYLNKESLQENGVVCRFTFWMGCDIQFHFCFRKGGISTSENCNLYFVTTKEYKDVKTMKDQLTIELPQPLPSSYAFELKIDSRNTRRLLRRIASYKATEFHLIPDGRMVNLPIARSVTVRNTVSQVKNVTHVLQMEIEHAIKANWILGAFAALCGLVVLIALVLTCCLILYCRTRHRRRSNNKRIILSSIMSAEEQLIKPLSQMNEVSRPRFWVPSGGPQDRVCPCEVKRTTANSPCDSPKADEYVTMDELEKFICDPFDHDQNYKETPPALPTRDLTQKEKNDGSCSNLSPEQSSDSTLNNLDSTNLYLTGYDLLKDEEGNRYSGVLCDRVDWCVVNPCPGNSTCVTKPDSSERTCICDEKDETCLLRVDPCISRPCQNGGICRESERESDGFVCDCTEFWTGSRCNQRLSPCMVAMKQVLLGLKMEPPCLNGGSCVENTENSSFACLCPPGTKGDRCELTTQLPTKVSFPGSMHEHITLTNRSRDQVVRSVQTVPFRADFHSLSGPLQKLNLV
ncbi:hypothetical protein T265_00061 [Opisthorchis viverrini]|uniref:EGF-like domain-containing protein n=1 Tax=Opisthorchis viverrini TaxID=6198 RepID=A0A075A3G5_OPIVI|nr:hypothetical protein T265_00061 [Opisthorchis viverrini]KER34198.1 hypothetical protein T265_00061 [Opisthorchis viverrini]